MTASTHEPLAYADKPLLDGDPLGEDVSQTVRPDEIELESRADQSTLVDVLRATEADAGQYDKLDLPSGGFRTKDPTGGDNTYRYAPRHAESPFLDAQDVLVDSYTERAASKDASTFRVRLVLKLASNPEPQTGLIDETAGASDWLFETYAGGIATERVRRDTDAESESGALGFVLSVALDATQAHALRSATGHIGAVGTVNRERTGADAVDNSPDKSNSLNLLPRDTSQVPRGHYVVRDVEFERLDPEGTWYRARVELLPNVDPLARATTPTATVTPTTATGGLGYVGVASLPTVAVTPRSASVQTSATAVASLPTLTGTPIQATALTDPTFATASKPTLTGTPRTASIKQPDDITGLEHWYDATALTGFNDGDSIGTWPDEEGSDDLTQATGSKQPTYQTDVFNGKPIVRFDGGDDYMDVDWSDLSQPNTLFLVLRERTTSTSAERYLGAVDESNGSHNLTNDSGDADRINMFAGSAVTAQNVCDTSWHIYTALFNGASSTLRQDASQVLSGDVGSQASSGPVLAANESGGFNNDIDVGEFIVYGSNPSNSDRDAVENYLAAKWGIAL